ncbi:DUF4422 domain-containing protein [Konateibacter massiliensis]|uniref:DUF4422 domain-containing protein n=1 Tax=Konateibacter massiliensis TaxID=2002841 RepID=UPI000C1467FA|nr:DUF4422 domain-containing protein [Konateibacter massiliensis]
MAVKMFTMTHKKFEEPEDEMYVPLHVGRALSEDLGYIGDNTGENISHLNGSFSELTGVYWVWKNEKEADYAGICHYRRYLINQAGRIFKEEELLTILKEYDVITSKRLQYDYTYYDGYADAHNINDLIETGKVIAEKYPDYYENFERLVHSKESYFGNIMVASKPLFDEYAQWLFDILQEVEKRIDISAYDAYHRRVFGFISEFLLLVWVETRKLKAYECMVGMSAEKYETREMKEKLAEYFAKKDVEGAKAYFMECYQKRPDVLLEASDTTGELKLSMQLISTCENEMQSGISCVLDRTTEYLELMRYFRNLNSIVKRYMLRQNLETDKLYFHRQKVSHIAISIAVMLFCEGQEAADTLNRIARDMEAQGDERLADALSERSLVYSKED